MENDCDLSLMRFKEIFNYEKIEASQLYYLINIYDNKNKFPILRKIIEEIFQNDNQNEKQEILLEPFIEYIFSLDNEIKEELISDNYTNLIESKKRIEKFYLSTKREINKNMINYTVKKLISLKNGKLFLIQSKDKNILYLFDSNSFDIMTKININNEDIIKLKNQNFLISYNGSLQLLCKYKYTEIKKKILGIEILKILELSNENILCIYIKEKINVYDMENIYQSKDIIWISFYNKNLELISEKKCCDNFSFDFLFQVNSLYYAIIINNNKKAIFGKENVVGVVKFFEIETNNNIKNFDVYINNYCVYDQNILFLFGQGKIMIINTNNFEIIQDIKINFDLNYLFLLNKEYIFLKDDENIYGHYILKIGDKFHFVSQENDILKDEYVNAIYKLNKCKIVFVDSECFWVKTLQ